MQPAPHAARVLSSLPMLLAALLAVLISLLPAAPARADGLIIIMPPDHPVPVPPIFPIPPGHPRYAPLEIRKHQVDVEITDQVAVTKVDQIFFNPSSLRLEGTYLFPIPEGANIDKFTMDINGKETAAELLSADKARAIYEEIVRKTRDPAILEYLGRGLFKVRIFPIEPTSEKRVRLRYTQLLKKDAGLVQYTYPLNTEKYSARPIQNVSLRVEVNASRPIKSIYSPSHEVEIRRPEPRRAVVGFEARDVKPDSDFQLFFAPQPADARDIDLNLLTFADPDDVAPLADGPADGRKRERDVSRNAGYFLLMASPGLLQDPAKIVKRDLTFVLDTSGSMAGPKLDQAKKALQFCLANLNPGDRFQILRFSTDVEPLFPEPLDASRDNLDKARRFIDSLKPIGGTAIAEALSQALAAPRAQPAGPARPSVVIFLTDGQPTIGETSEEAILRLVADKLHRKRDRGVDREREQDRDRDAGRGDHGVRSPAPRIFCFGIGTDINTHLLDKIAAKAGGTTQYVLPNEDLEVKLSAFFTKVSQPVLANLRLSFTNLRVSRLYPSPLPDLFQGDQLLVMGRYEGSGHAAVTLEGDVNGQPRKFTTETRFPERAAEHEFIPRLWAVRRVGHLLEEIRLRGDHAELRDEIVDLARRHGIVTPYTSYLIVEDEMRRGVPVPMQTHSRLGSSSGTRAELDMLYRRSNTEKAGAEAIVSAREAGRLKSASAAPSASAHAADEAYGLIDGPAAGSAAGGAGPAASASPRSDRPGLDAKSSDARQQVRVVNRRAFFQNGSQWIDSRIQANAAAPRVQVQVGSAAYFDLLKKHPESNAWLSLGPNVQVMLGSTIYELMP